MSAELIERLTRAADDPMWAHHAEVPKFWLRDAIEALVSQDKRIAELEANQWPSGTRPSKVQGFSGQGVGMVWGSVDDMGVVQKAMHALSIEPEFRRLVRYWQEECGKLNTALSLAESRGRQTGREEAAKIVDKAAAAMREANAKGPPGAALRVGVIVIEGLLVIAAAIRNLPANEVGE